MRPIVTGATLLALLAAPAAAQDEPAPAPQTSKAFLALQDEYDDAYQEWLTEYRASIDAWNEAREADAENAPARPSMPAPVEPNFFPRFLELADAGEPEAQVWVLMQYHHSGLSGETAKRDKLDRYLDLFASHPDGPWMERVPMLLASDARPNGVLGRDAALTLLDLVGIVSTDTEIQASALYMKASVDDGYGASADDKKVALAGYRTVSETFPKTMWGQRAGGKVFKEENLVVGMTAPDFEDTDVDGNPLKLSDFKGKVVVIDFWGFW